MILQLVFHVAYELASKMCPYLDESATKYIMTQHDADEEIECTHTHVCVDWPMTVEALRKVIVKNELDGRGKYAILQKTQKSPRVIYDYDKLAVYVLKGDISTLRKQKSHTQEEIAAYVAAWVHHGVEDAPASTDTKATKDRTRWQVVQDVIEETQKIHGVWVTCYEDPFGNDADSPALRIKSHATVFKVLLKHLRINKISTSRNELERLYVTLLRHDPWSSQEIFTSIHKNVFRTL